MALTLTSNHGLHFITLHSLNFQHFVKSIQNMDFFRRLFGFSGRDASSGTPQPPSYDFEEHNHPNNHNRTGNDWTKFDVFTDPIEMHRYFEQQMDHILKQFGMPGFGDFFSGLNPPIESEKDSLEGYSPESREYFLKREPYYEPAVGSEKIDKDLDGKLNAEDLEKLFKSPKNEHSIVPRENNSLDIKLFGMGEFNKPGFNDGFTFRSYETRKTITDSQGNRETVVTKIIGDKEYTIIKKTDKQGNEEIIEKTVNMSEQEKNDLSNNARNPITLFDDNLFSKFFR